MKKKIPPPPPPPPQRKRKEESWFCPLGKGRNYTSVLDLGKKYSNFTQCVSDISSIMCAYDEWTCSIEVYASRWWEVLELVREVFGLNLPLRAESLCDELHIFQFCIVDKVTTKFGYRRDMKMKKVEGCFSLFFFPTILCCYSRGNHP